MPDTTWLDNHLETFVRPQLGMIPNINPNEYYIRVFDKKILISLNLFWLEAKRVAQGRTILLPGRDVYLLEVIARMYDDYPTVFRPEISSSVAPYVKEDYTEHFCVDTGYQGSVPKMLKMNHWKLMRGSVGWTGKQVQERQLFPNNKRGTLYAMSTNLESCPKYWERANPGFDANNKFNGVINQRIDHTNFPNAAQITMIVARSVGMIRPRRYFLPSLPFGRFC